MDHADVPLKDDCRAGSDEERMGFGALTVRVA